MASTYQRLGLARGHGGCPKTGMAYEGDPLALVLLTAAPHRMCGPCLATRARLEMDDAWMAVTLLAETMRFNARVGLCYVCTDECVTFGASESGRRNA